MSNLVSAFEEIVACYDFKGDLFRKKSYEKVLRILRELGEVNGINEVKDIKDVGSSTLTDIEQILTTGTCNRLEQLRKECPPASVAELTKIPGVGPKTAAKLWQIHNVTNLKELKAKIDSGEIVDAKLKEGVEFAITSSARTPLGFVLPVVQPILDAVKKQPEVLDAEFAGSVRRRKETIGDVDIIVKCNQITPTLHNNVRLVLGHAVVVDAEGDRKIRARVRGIQVDVLFVPKDEYGAALQYFTGSKEHNVVLRVLAKNQGMLLNEKGLFKGAEKVAGETEEGIYKVLGVPYLPPELRQDGTEIGKTAPELITTKDIVGLLHNHTTWSDGGSSIEEIVEAARQRGLKYIAITDHSQAMAIARGLPREGILEEIAFIKNYQQQVKDIRILASCEMDVLGDGKCDYDDEVINQFDIVLLALHRQPRVNVADRFITAIKHLREELKTDKLIILAHPSGRQFDKSPIAETDWDKLFDVCAKYNVILEINSLPERLDLDYSLCKKAKAKGIKFSISTDSHAIGNMDLVELGIDVARRAWLTKQDVVNTNEVL